MKKLLLISLFILFAMCSRSWALSACPGSPQNGGNVSNWDNCWGVYNHIDGDNIGDSFYGLFINNIFIKGTYEYNSKSHGVNSGDIYIGEFYNNPEDLSDLRMQGNGIYYLVSAGEVYDGEHYNNKRSGFGKNFWTQGEFAGSVYVGNFSDGNMSGFGTYYWGNDYGRIYMGQFSNDKANGSGLLIESNGKIWSGKFNNWDWVSGNEVTNNYRGKMPDPHPHFDRNKYAKKDNQEYNFARKQNKKKNINPNEIINAASGSGFVVSSSGHIVTNNHVINGCNDVKVHQKGKIFKATIVDADYMNDLAIIKADISPSIVFSISGQDAELLQDIYVAGYPFGAKISSSIKVTKGIVSSLSGIGNNYSNMQIDAALQPGNSGGPILDERGNVVGVAVAKLDLSLMLEEFGTIPEDTNFGIKSSTLLTFLRANGINTKNRSDKNISRSELGQKITDGTLFLSCWMSYARIEELRTKKVMFENLK